MGALRKSASLACDCAWKILTFYERTLGTASHKKEYNYT